MNLIYNKIFLEHETGIHPESARRFEYLKNLKETEVDNGEKYLELVHPKKYIDFVRESCKKSLDLDPDTKTCPKTFEVACKAVGAAIHASKNNDFALVRPPGHHATADRAMGFCIFNNEAIATQRLVNKGKKVFILDFDCHYGNGTSEIFYNSDNVLYMSMHQYPYYPGNGFINEIGAGDGKGFTINIPILPKTGDDIYLEILNFFIPIIKEQFKPDVVCCSAGFDGHHSDPICDLSYSLNAFHQTGKLLRENFKDIFAVLEGGYDPKWLARCIMDFQDGINGKETSFSDDPMTKTLAYNRQKFNDNFEQLKMNLKPYWKLNALINLNPHF